MAGELKAVDAAKNNVTLSTFSRADGKSEKSYSVAKDAKILRDGRDAKLADLEVGSKATLTLSLDQAAVVSIVAGIPQMSAPLKSVDTSKNTITVTIGGGRTEKQDKTYQVVKDAKITIDGKDARHTDLKAGAILTLAVTDGSTVTEIRMVARRDRNQNE